MVKTPPKYRRLQHSRNWLKLGRFGGFQDDRSGHTVTHANFQPIWSYMASKSQLFNIFQEKTRAGKCSRSVKLKVDLVNYDAIWCQIGSQFPWVLFGPHGVPGISWKIDVLDACLMVHGSWLKAHGSWPREARGGSWLMARCRPGPGDPEPRGPKAGYGGVAY